MVNSVESGSAKTVEDVRDCVQRCAASGVGLMPVGGGTRIHIGHQPSKDIVELSTASLNNIVEYNPDDLVVIAEAGMTLSALQLKLKEHGQWLPIDISAPERQTLGGIVASRANSLLRSGCGSVRDWLIGVELVNADADIVIGGGKVVKNVAGYDLPKLYCGSWGTLGILTKTNFKVSPLPETSLSALIVLSADRNSEDLIDAVLSTVNPTAAILFNDLCATRILGPDSEKAQYLYIRFLGQQEDVDAQIVGAASICAPYASQVLRLPEQVGTSLFRLLCDFSADEAPLSVEYHILSSQVGAHVRMVQWTAARYGLTVEIVADVSSGIVSAHFFAEDVEYGGWAAFLPEFQDKATRVGGSLIIERMPDEWRALNVPVWSPVLSDFQIMKLIKRKLDPGNLFNPGRFMGGL